MEPLRASKKRDPGVPVGTMALALALVMFVMGSDLNIVSPFLLDMSRSFHVPVSAVGWLVTAFAAGYVLASPVAGWLSDRFGRLATLVVGMAGFVVFETVSAIAPTLLAEVLSRLLAGVTAGAVSPVAYAIVGDMVPRAARGRTMAILSMGFSASTVLGVPLGLWLSTAVGWRGTLLAIGAALAVAGGALLVLLRRLTPPPSIARTQPVDLPVVLYRTWPNLAASFMAFLAMGIVYTYLPTALVHRGLPRPTGLMAVLAAYGLFNLAGNWLSGRLGDRFGSQRIVLWAQGAELVALLILAATAGGRVLALMIGAAWLFALVQAYIPDLKVLASDVPAYWRGTSLAFNNTAMYGGMTVGSALGSAVYRPGVFPALALVGAAAAGFGFMAMHIKRHGRREEPTGGLRAS